MKMKITTTTINSIKKFPMNCQRKAFVQNINDIL